MKRSLEEWMAVIIFLAMAVSIMFDTPGPIFFVCSGFLIIKVIKLARFS